MKGARLVLGKSVLVIGDGEETKYADEVMANGVGVTFWERGRIGMATGPMGMI